MDLERIVVRIGADATDYFGVLDEVESRMAALGADLAFKFIRTVSQLGMEWEAMTTSFNTMIGSADKGMKVLGEIRDLAIRSPFTTQGLTRAGEMLLGFGTDADNLVPILERLGDVAGGNEAKLMRLALAFGQVQTAGRFMGTELRQFAEVGVGAKDFAKIAGTTEAKFMRDIKSGKISPKLMEDAINALTDSGGRFAGRSDALFKTVSGQFNALKENLQKMGADLAVKFFDRFNVAGKIGGLASFFESLQKQVDPFVNWLERVSPIFQEFVDLIKVDFKIGQDLISELIGEPVSAELVHQVIRDMIDSVISASKFVLVNLAEFGDMIRTNIQIPMLSFAKTLFDVFMAIEDTINRIHITATNAMEVTRAMAFNASDAVDPRDKNGNLIRRGLYYAGRDILGLDDPAGKTVPNIITEAGQMSPFSGKIRKMLDELDFFVQDRRGPEKIANLFDRMQRDMDKQRRETDFWRNVGTELGKFGIGDAKKFFQGISMMGFKAPGADQISSSPRLPADVEKFAAGIEKAYQSRNALEVFANNIEKVRVASEGIGPKAATMLQLMTGANVLGTRLAFPAALSPEQAEFGLFQQFQTLQKAIGGIDLSTKLPKAIKEGTVEAQEIINRSQKPEMTVQEEIRKTLIQGNIIMEEQKKYQKDMADEIKKNFPKLEELLKKMNGEEV